MFVFSNETLQYLIRKLKEKFASKQQADSKVDKVSGKDLTDADFTDGAKNVLTNKYDILNSKETTDSIHIELQSSDLQTKEEIELKHGCDAYIYPLFEIKDGLVFKVLTDDVEIPYVYIAKKDYSGTVKLTIKSEEENIEIEQIHNLSTLKSKGTFVVSGLTLNKEYKLTLTIISNDNSFKGNHFEKTITVKEYSYIIDYDYDRITSLPSGITSDPFITKCNYYGDGLARAYLYVNNTSNSYATQSMSFNNTSAYYVVKIPSTSTSFYAINSKNLRGSIEYVHNGITTMQNLFNSSVSIERVMPVGSAVSNMQYAYYNCKNLIGNPVCGPNVTNMYNTYAECRNLTGQPVCGPNVINMSYAYNNCYNLTGSPACGASVKDMYYAYGNCYNLTGSPVCGPNVTNMTYAYYRCINLTGSPVCGDKVVSLYGAYSGCRNLTGPGVCGNSVTNMNYAYEDCTNLSGYGIIGPKVKVACNAFKGCDNIRNIYVHSNVLSNCRNMVNNRSTKQKLQIFINKAANSTSWSRLTASNTTFAIVDTISYTNQTINSSRNEYCLYNTAYNIYIYSVGDVYKSFKYNELASFIYYSADNTLRPKEVLYLNDGYEVSIEGEEIVLIRNNTSENISYINMSDSSSLTKVDFVYSINTINNMHRSFYNCTNLTGPAVCGPNVTNMAWTYYNCTSLTGSPVCGPNVTDMDYAYGNCYSLTGSPVCGKDVTTMRGAYINCINLIKAPVCGSNVIDMNMAYCNCTNLTGPSVVNKNVQILHQTFKDCINLHGNLYVASNKVNDAAYCFNGRNYNNKLNIYIPTNGYSETINSLNTFLATSGSVSIVGADISWEYNSSNKCYYNTYHNTYIYPKDEDILKVYKENEFLIARYKMRAGSNTMPFLSNITCYTEDMNNEDGTVTRSLYCNDGYNFNYGISFGASHDLLEVHNLRLDYVTNAAQMFSGCQNLTYVNAANFVTTNIVNMYGMFRDSGVSSRSFDGAEWDIGNVTDLRTMFWNCKNL